MCKTSSKLLLQSVRFIDRLARRVHRDERGTISILTVFVLLMFTMVLLMIVNVARHLDDKVKMQNAADAAAHSGGVVLARGMNSIAFTNHLLGDVFAMTAFLREGRDRQAESLTPDILNAYREAARKFSSASFPKFADLGNAMADKIEREQTVVDAFGDVNQAASEMVLPVFEAILAREMIPQFQRTVLRTIPDLARQTAGDVALRHGLRQQELQGIADGSTNVSNSRRSPQQGVLWRSSGLPVGAPDENDPLLRTLPVVDADPFGSDAQGLANAQQYQATAVLQRRELAMHYLESWNRDKLRLFSRDAAMSQLINLWRLLTNAKLTQLLEQEYPEANLPMVVRETQSGQPLESITVDNQTPAGNAHLDDNFHFVAVVYRDHLRESGPGLFQNPLDFDSDALTFAQVSLFLPRPRYYLVDATTTPDEESSAGGSFGYDSSVGGSATDPAGAIDPDNAVWRAENWPRHWDMLNQNWMVKLVPATTYRLGEILQTNPPVESVGIRVPNLENTNVDQMRTLNNH